MAKYNIAYKKTGNLLLTIVIYDKKMVNCFLKQFRKMKNINVIEVEK